MTSKKVGKNGFTLIELMIAMAIMGGLVALVGQSIFTAVKSKKSMAGSLDSMSTMFDTLRIIKQDVEKAFHHHDFIYQIEKKSIQNYNEEIKGGSSQQAQSQDLQTLSLPPAPPQLTAFIGEESEMNFTTLTNVRTQYNIQESDQMEVGYAVDACTLRTNRNKTSRCLFRRTTPYIDDDVTEGGRRMALAEHVTEFSLAYKSNDEDDEWENEWRSDGKGRAQHKDKFPHLVRVTIEIHDKDKKGARRIRDQIIIPVHFPNNTLLFQDTNNRSNSRNSRTRRTR